jgi:hypothetical protein
MPASLAAGQRCRHHSTGEPRPEFPGAPLIHRLLSIVTGARQPLPPPSDPTARAMTSKEVRSAAVACSPSTP